MPAYTKEQQTKRQPKKRPKPGYHQATERARSPLGHLVCEGCGRSLLDGQEQRHHVKHRSQGGDNSADNLRVVCGECHLKAHGISEKSRDKRLHT